MGLSRYAQIHNITDRFLISCKSFFKNLKKEALGSFLMLLVLSVLVPTLLIITSFEKRISKYRVYK